MPNTSPTEKETVNTSRMEFMVTMVDQPAMTATSYELPKPQPIEAEAFGRQQEIEDEALRLYQTDPAKAEAFLTKYCQGIARLDAAGLSPGEQQFCLLLLEKGQANQAREGGLLFYLLDEGIHEKLLDSLANPGLSLRAAAKSA
jgi:hypothetical protein